MTRRAHPLKAIFDVKAKRGAPPVGAQIGSPYIAPYFYQRVHTLFPGAGFPLHYWIMDDAAAPLDDESTAGTTWNGVASGSGVTYQQTAMRADLRPCVNFGGSGWFETSTGAVGGALSFVVMCWVQFTASGGMVFAQQRDAAAFLGEWMLGTISFGGTADNKLHAWGFGTDAAMEFDLSSPGTINDGNPHLVGFTLDQSDTTARLWLDGALVATDTTPNGSLFDSTLNIGIGRDVRDNNKTYNGKMSDLIIDLYAPTAAEWAYLYNAP